MIASENRGRGSNQSHFASFSLQLLTNIDLTQICLCMGGREESNNKMVRNWIEAICIVKTKEQTQRKYIMGIWINNFVFRPNYFSRTLALSVKPEISRVKEGRCLSVVELWAQRCMLKKSINGVSKSMDAMKQFFLVTSSRVQPNWCLSETPHTSHKYIKRPVGKKLVCSSATCSRERYAEAVDDDVFKNLPQNEWKKSNDDDRATMKRNGKRTTTHIQKNKTPAAAPALILAIHFLRFTKHTYCWGITANQPTSQYQSKLRSSYWTGLLAKY